MNYPDLQTLTLVGRIANLTVITTEDDRECLVVTLYHRITTDTTITVKFLNSNGLLTAHTNNNLVIGQELTVVGKLTGIRSFYMKDDVLTPLKQPEFQLEVPSTTRLAPRPQPKAEPEPPARSNLGYYQEQGKGRAYARTYCILTLALRGFGPFLQDSISCSTLTLLTTL
jgi:hypothetical protein